MTIKQLAKLDPLKALEVLSKKYFAKKKEAESLNSALLIVTFECGRSLISVEKPDVTVDGGEDKMPGDPGHQKPADFWGDDRRGAGELGDGQRGTRGDESSCQKG